MTYGIFPGGDQADAEAEFAATVLASTRAALDCADGRHQTNPDPETGDEVCRWCEKVIE